MDVTENSSANNSVCGGGSDEPAGVEPLTRSGFMRLAEIERQISEAVPLDWPTLVGRAQQRDEADPDFLSPEALVYFIRQAIRNGDVRNRDNLFRELLVRCNPHFRGKFRGFGPEDREDLQGEVQRMIIEDLFRKDDRSDFMQVRFWTYLERKCIDACRAMFRQTDDTESLETGLSGEGVSEGLTRLEVEVDEQISPEDFTTISKELEKLPPRLRHVFLLRHYVGMKIGTDNLDKDKDEGRELTIAAHYGRTGRTIRNWLKEADRLLAEFQEKNDGE